MKTILIVNTTKKACAVHQYGWNLWIALNQHEQELMAFYLEADTLADVAELLTKMEVHAIIYNWHPTQGGFLRFAPFEFPYQKPKQVAIFHEIVFDTDKFDAVLYTGFPSCIPTTVNSANWYRIPLNLPAFKGYGPLPEGRIPYIGVNGYGGAFADRAVEQIIKDFKQATVRLHMPFADYGDADGTMAKQMAIKCSEELNETPFDFHIKLDWMDQDELLRWLEQNDLNVYIRPTDTPWTGVSAAMCSALAVQRPLAISRSECFRHLWNVTPSICVEDRSLKEILATGIDPLLPVYVENAPEKLAFRIEQIMEDINL